MAKEYPQDNRDTHTIQDYRPHQQMVLNDNNNPDEEYGLPTRAYGNAWDLGIGKNPMAPRLPKKGK